MNKLAIVLILSLSLHLNTSAQIVNIESARMQSDTTGWKGELGAAFSLAQNTSKIFQATLDAHLQYKTKNDRGIWFILGNLGFLKVGGDRFVADDLLHLRYNKKINNWLRWEFFGQYQNNIITQIDSRILLGSGPRFKLVNTEKFRLYAATLLMNEWEKERTSPVINHNNIRNSTYISFSWLPEKKVEILSTAYFQPQVNKFKDHRILNQVALKILATVHLGMFVKWNYLYDSFPAGDAPHNTYNFTTGFTYNL